MKEKHLKLSLEKATQDNKQLLVDLYGAEHFEAVKDRLKGYESACVILNRQVITIDSFSFLSNEQAKRQFARHKIQTCIEAINEGWFPDFDNSNQYKYYIWMYGKKNSFSSGVFLIFSHSFVGSDLHIETKEKAQVIEKICRQDYIDYLF